jgi:hypothetical protein
MYEHCLLMSNQETLARVQYNGQPLAIIREIIMLIYCSCLLTDLCGHYGRQFCLMNVNTRYFFLIFACILDNCNWRF